MLMPMLMMIKIKIISSIMSGGANNIRATS